MLYIRPTVHDPESRPNKDLEKISSIHPQFVYVCNAILHLVAFTCHAPTLADEINGQAVKHYNVLDRENC